MSKCKTALPYVLRVTASGSLFVGSLINLMSGEKPNPFFYCSLYSAGIYTFSNLYESYKAYSAPTVTREQIANLEAITVTTFESKVVASREQSQQLFRGAAS